jgi:undecaprenyl-diphosphatase
MILLKVLILAVIQGAAELLPVSSSAHVIVAEKLMGLDPTRPEMTLLLVMLHTGTMFAVIFYFWSSWRDSFFSSRRVFAESLFFIVSATAITGVVGIALKTLIEKVFFRHVPHAEIEMLFGNLGLIAVALFAAGVFTIWAGRGNRSRWRGSDLGLRESSIIGAVQGLCLPFRGFSRSGATISAGLVLGASKKRVEEFSFALAVVLTPPIILREVMRLLKARAEAGPQAGSLLVLFFPSVIGMFLSFGAGILALMWLSRWLEKGRWQVFGFYCIFASIFVFLLHRAGF